MKAQLLSPKAKQDIERIWDYTEEKWGVSQAEFYINSIPKILDGLCDGAVVSQSAAQIRDGYRKVLIGSHVIFFKENANSIEVIRILHQRMHTTHLFEE